MSRLWQQSRFAAESKSRPNMKTISRRTHRLAALGWATLLVLAIEGAIPAQAQALSQAQPASPLALARHFQALTEGGLFSPVEDSASDRGHALDAQQSHDPSSPAIPLDRDLL
jgi:hypothetical protein